MVGFGVLATTYRYVLTLVGIEGYTNTEIRLYLGRYLALGLEFQLGADILSTAVAPTIDDVIMLGAIATIRTVLNYFLSQELERERRQVAPPAPLATTRATLRAVRSDPLVDLYRDALSLLRVLALAVGTLVIFLGIVRAARVARGGRGRAADSMLGHASLGLEFFVGATLLNLVLKPHPNRGCGHGRDDRRPQAPDVLPRAGGPGRRVGGGAMPRALGPRGLRRTPGGNVRAAPHRSASEVRGLGSATRTAQTRGGRRPPPWYRHGASPSSLRRSRRRPLPTPPVARREPEIPRRRHPCPESPRLHLSAPLSNATTRVIQ